MRSSSGEHFLGLDHVRALAALLVFSWHFIHGTKGSPVPFEGAPDVFPLAIFDEGHTGVALFMTLSGYLFAKLLDGKAIHYPSFLWNRFVRLVPLLALVLVIFTIIEVQTGADLKSVLLRIASGVVRPTLPNGGWSITVEFHFYLLLPLLLYAARRHRFAPFAFLVLTVIARAALYLRFGEVQRLAYFTIGGRVDQFILGIAAFQFSGAMRNRHAVALLTAVAFTGFYWLFDLGGGYDHAHYPSTNPIWIVLPTIEGAAYAVLIAYYDQSYAPGTGTFSKLLGMAGAYSYSIYLLHFFFVFRLARFIDGTIMDISNWYLAFLWALICFALTIPLGHLSFRFIESPFLRFRRRYTQSPAGNARSPAGNAS